MYFVVARIKMYFVYYHTIMDFLVYVYFSVTLQVLFYLYMETELLYIYIYFNSMQLFSIFWLLHFALKNSIRCFYYL